MYMACFSIRIWWGLVLRGDGASVYCVDCYVVMGGDIISNDVTNGAVSVLRCLGSSNRCDMCRGGWEE